MVGRLVRPERFQVPPLLLADRPRYTHTNLIMVVDRLDSLSVLHDHPRRAARQSRRPYWTCARRRARSRSRCCRSQASCELARAAAATRSHQAPLVTHGAAPDLRASQKSCMTCCGRSSTAARGTARPACVRRPERPPRPWSCGHRARRTCSAHGESVCEWADVRASGYVQVAERERLRGSVHAPVRA
jgi:hypothetical protein